MSIKSRFFNLCFISKIIINVILKLNSKTYIIRTGGVNAWKQYLNVEKCGLKLCRTRCHLRFFRLCYNISVIPKFLLFRLLRPD